MKINIFPAGQLGGEVKMIQAVRTGTQDLVITGGGPVENTAKEFSVYSFPYLFKDLDQANSVMQGPVGQEMLDLLSKHRLLGLGFISPIERNIFTNGKRITNADDMKGLKIRVIQGQGFVKTYEALGAQPTPMAYAELYTALQNGAVDAAENSPDVFVQDKFIEVSKTYTMARVMYMPALMLMSPSRFERLSPEQQQVIREAAAAAIASADSHYKKGYADSMKIIKDRGVEIIEPDIESFRQIGASVHAGLLESLPDTKPWYEKIVAQTK
ncbi:TRAP transporter substrate-binding protein [Castellaniella sp. S9]|uniref:TRAP transporter substrate-binding protein n=1 Tax=Castellaniella sp. S9 TaxID=2993652 RepID=UPI0022B328F6|nr:TRAP transporter substrate-binding protein [Castellaniella sp. S9]